jgi:signal transduction histidine kinase
MTLPGELPSSDWAGVDAGPGSQWARQPPGSAAPPTDGDAATQGGVVSGALRAALASAAQRAGDSIAAADHKTADELRSQFEKQVELLVALASGHDVASDDSRFNTPRRFVDVLRREFVRQLTDAVPHTLWENPRAAWDLIALLGAIEEFVRRGEDSTTGRFVARLTGPESANAIVEIAHDIRSPLSSILFLVETIRRGKSGPVSELQERQLALVYGAALGLSALSSDLIDAVRGERLVDGRAVPFSIAEVILGVCAIVEPIGEEKGLPLKVDLPTIDGRVGYPSALHRVLLNLASNALHYTDTGFVLIGAADREGTSVEFSVQDTGRGIPDNVLAMLFDGFRPAAGGLRFSSAGLGLAISRTLLQAMGGTLRVETSPERGTRFSFVLELPIA